MSFAFQAFYTPQNIFKCKGDGFIRKHLRKRLFFEGNIVDKEIFTVVWPIMQRLRQKSAILAVEVICKRENQN